jgi:hypothetical protein
MRWLGIIVASIVLGAASPVLAQSNPPSPKYDRAAQGNQSDPPDGLPRGPANPNMSEAPFTPRGYGPPPPNYGPSYDPRYDQRPDPRDARRAPPPPPKSHADRRPPPREAHRAPPPPSHRDARRDDRGGDPRLDRRPPPPRDYRDARREPPRYREPPRRYDDRPPPHHADRRDPRDDRRAYRDDPRREPPRYDRRGPPPREYREARREPPRRDYRDERRYDPRGNPNLSVEHRRALLRDYERNARRQLEIERELSGAQPGPPPRDRYSDARPPRR